MVALNYELPQNLAETARTRHRVGIKRKFGNEKLQLLLLPKDKQAEMPEQHEQAHAHQQVKNSKKNFPHIELHNDKLYR